MDYNEGDGEKEEKVTFELLRKMERKSLKDFPGLQNK